MFTSRQGLTVLLAGGIALSTYSSSDPTKTQANAFSTVASEATSSSAEPATTTSATAATSKASSVPTSTQSDGALSADPDSDPIGLPLVGTSGSEIVINRLWVQGCIPGTNAIDWQDSRRVLVTDAEPFVLVTTLTDYQNGSATTDC